MPFAKTLTIDGRKYRVHTVSYDDYVRLAGPGLITSIALPAGVALDSPDLREQVRAALERQRANDAAARESVRRNTAPAIDHDAPTPPHGTPLGQRVLSRPCALERHAECRRENCVCPCHTQTPPPVDVLEIDEGEHSQADAPPSPDATACAALVLLWHYGVTVKASVWAETLAWSECRPTLTPAHLAVRYLTDLQGELWTR